MKICFFNLNAYSIFNKESGASIGGTEIQLFLLSQHMSKNDNINVSFITGDWGQGDHETHGKVTVYKSISLQKRFINYLKAPFIVWNKLRKINADVYIASSAGIEIGIISLFCLLSKKKFIYRTAHDMDCSGEYSKQGVAGKIYDFGIKNANLVVTQTENNRLILQENYGIEAVVVKNAYNIPIKKELNKENYILWVSRCEKWKNPIMALNIAASLPKYMFTMICNKQKYQEELFLKIKNKVAKLGNINFIERVPFDQIQSYYDKATLFIGTSEYEGFPNTYLQACIGGTPIVSYKVNPDNFITENNLGYCADGDLIKMIEQIKKILLDKNDWKVKSENAYRYVKENHDIDIVGKQWKKLIYKLLNN